MRLGSGLVGRSPLPCLIRRTPGLSFNSMIAYAVALDAAQPWLDTSAPAPTWFGLGESSSLESSDLDTAFHGFMNSVEWGLSKRFEATTKERAEERTFARPQNGDATSGAQVREEAPLETWSSPLDYGEYPPTGWSEEAKERRGCGGCLMWVVGLLGTGVVVLLVVVVVNLVSPAVKPCPTNSPMILTPAQIVVLMDLVVNECTSVVGEVVWRENGELVVEVDRGEYVQSVKVIGPPDVLEQAPFGIQVHIAGWIREDADWGYVVQYGVDRGWWGNLRENLPGDFLDP